MEGLKKSSKPSIKMSLYAGPRKQRRADISACSVGSEGEKSVACPQFSDYIVNKK